MMLVDLYYLEDNELPKAMLVFVVVETISVVDSVENMIVVVVLMFETASVMIDTIVLVVADKWSELKFVDMAVVVIVLVEEFALESVDDMVPVVYDIVLVVFVIFVVMVLLELIY